MATPKKEVKEVVKKADSAAYKAFEAHIANYAKLNPAKYEAKKEALEAKLATL